ncbi:hypothetical protein D3C80_2007610 [compost metagenome]
MRQHEARRFPRMLSGPLRRIHYEQIHQHPLPDQTVGLVRVTPLRFTARVLRAEVEARRRRAGAIQKVGHLR